MAAIGDVDLMRAVARQFDPGDAVLGRRRDRIAVQGDAVDGKAGGGLDRQTLASGHVDPVVRPDLTACGLDHELDIVMQRRVGSRDQAGGQHQGQRGDRRKSGGGKPAHRLPLKACHGRWRPPETSPRSPAFPHPARSTAAARCRAPAAARCRSDRPCLRASHRRPGGWHRRP